MSAEEQRFSPKARSAARKRVLQALYQWQLTGQDIQLIESQFLAEQTLENDQAIENEPDTENELDMRQVDIPYFQRLLQGIAQLVEQLDTAFAPFLDRSSSQLDPIELAILRIGSYELTHCPDIPFKVVISEAIELAKQFGATQSYKYVNGILDRLAHPNKKKPHYRNKTRAGNVDKQVHIKKTSPKKLFLKGDRAMPKQVAQAINLEKNNVPPPSEKSPS
jgi:N utilization substance protein B